MFRKRFSLYRLPQPEKLETKSKLSSLVSVTKQVAVLPFIADLQPPHHPVSASAPGPQSISRSVQVTVNSEPGQTVAWPERCLITPR